MKYKGVIFDLDGTLINSLEDLADSMNAVLQNNHFPIHELQSYRYFIGNGLRNLVRKTLPEAHNDEETVSSCLDSLIEIYRNNCLNKTRPYQGITELLDELTLRNLKLCVFSNKADELTKKIVPALFPNRKFEEIVGLTKEAHKKPDPSGALQISGKIKICPEEMIYIGDSGVDMQTANNAGMFAVGALWGFRQKEELRSNGAQYLIEHPTDLIQIL